MTYDNGHKGMAEVHRLAAEIDFPETLGAFVRERANTLGDQVIGDYFDDGEKLTYRGLDQSADRLAGSLLGLGVRKGTHVSVMLPNVKEFVISWIALGRLGAVMVPTNIAYTGAELHFVLADSDAQFMIIDSSFLERLDNMPEWPTLLARERIIVRGEAPAGHLDWHELHDNGPEDFKAPSRVTSTDLVNLQYTSGTTGFPKGCMLTHEYWVLLAHCAALQRGRPFQIKQTLIWAPFFYMDGQWQFLMTMCLGGTAHIASRMSLTNFFDWLIDFEIEYCAFPEPALARFPPSEKDKLIKLKYVNAFGWRGDANIEIEKRFNLVARNTFGMTEIGSGISLPAEATHMAGSEACGLPSPFREVRIVDEEGNDVPQGEPGELWVSGPAILWGYYKRPEANAESFRGKWFRTGDIFQQDENGYYYIVGRIKDMIKRAGENISAREVEAVLRGMDEIEEAAALAVPDPMRREEVKVFLMLREGVTAEDCPPEKIIAHCGQHLADFKIPRYYAYVDEFPRTPTGKIAKNKMRDGDLRENSFDRADNLWR
ncbi:AMP-binding protein [Sneathiella sp. DP05]|uniref:AMP-binding protein n=2 Tax=Sneathiella litorea TaxID=2606216 RepID=A0A6L8W8T5_9PROT|nr:AMP-binding protein [Sneathiella litorea]